MAIVNVSVTTANVTANSTTSNITVAQTTSNVTISNVATLSNANIVREQLSVVDTGGDGSLTYANSTGVFTYTGPSATEVRSHFSNVAPILYDATTGVISANTDAIFSNTLANNWFTSQTTDNLTEGTTNKYYSSTLFDTDLATKTTDNLTEGTNLYYTTDRSNTAIGAYTGSMLNLTGGIATTANISGNYFLGDGGLLSNIITNAQVKTYIEANGLDGTANLTTTGNVNANGITVWDGGNGPNNTGFGNLLVGNVRIFGGLPGTTSLTVGKGLQAEFANITSNLGVSGNIVSNGNIVLNHYNANLDFRGGDSIPGRINTDGAFDIVANKNVSASGEANIHEIYNDVYTASGKALTMSLSNIGLLSTKGGISTNLLEPANGVILGKNTASSGGAKITLLGTANSYILSGGSAEVNIGTDGSTNAVVKTNSIVVNNSVDGDEFIARSTDLSNSNNYGFQGNLFSSGRIWAKEVQIQTDGKLFGTSNSHINNMANVDTANLLVTDTATFSGATSITATGNVSIGGNLDVTGNINSETVVDLFVEDRNITLQYGAVGTPSANSQIFVDRGDESNTYIKWDEGSDSWKFSNDGTTEYKIPASTSDLAEGTNLYYTDARVDTHLNTSTASASEVLSWTGSDYDWVAAQSGPTGPTGPQGTKGEVGPQGTAGDKGQKGELGPQGTQGTAGDKGQKGELGPQGATGPQGAQGVAGDKGQKGELGPQGATGDKGQKGELGPQGATGPTGPQGPQGATGPTGDKGQKGELGPESTIANRVVKTVIAGENLAKGDAVYISGGTGDNPEVSKADADDATKMPVFGVTTEAVTATNTTDIVIYGLLESYDTTGFTTGDSLFVSTTPGVLTTTKPTGESALLQTVGKVIKGNSSGGKITITGAGRTNATPNLDEGNIFLGSSSGTAITVTPDSNFTTTGNAFSLSNTLSDIKKVTFEGGSNLELKGNIINTTTSIANTDFTAITTRNRGTYNRPYYGTQLYSDASVTQSSSANTELSATYVGGVLAGPATDNFPADGTITVTEGSNVVKLTGLSIPDDDNRPFSFGGFYTPNTKTAANVATHFTANMMLLGNDVNDDVMLGFPPNTIISSVANSDVGGNANIIMSNNASTNITKTLNDAGGSPTYVGIFHSAINSDSDRIALTGYNINNDTFTRFAISGLLVSGRNIGFAPNIANTFDQYNSITITDIDAQVTAADYSYNDLSVNQTTVFNQLDTPSGLVNTKYGLTIGANTSMDSRMAPRGTLPNFGINLKYPGTDEFVDEFGISKPTATYSPIQAGLNFFSHTNRTVQGTTSSGLHTRGGPRVMLGSLYGDENDALSSHYPRENYEIGKFSWWGPTQTNYDTSTTLPPAFITGTAASDWQSAVDIDVRHFGTGSDGTQRCFLGYVDSNTFIGANSTISLGQGPGVTANIVSEASALSSEWANVSSTGIQTSGAVIGANVVLKKFNETKVDLGTVSGDQSSALNATNGSIYKMIINGDVTINSIANAVAGTSMTIIVTQDGVGSRTLTSSMKFAGGDKTLSTASGAIDVISVFYDGTTYYASLTKAYA